jgi:hypothetical protein
MEHIKPVPGFDGYFASEDGKVYSSWVTGAKPYMKPGKLKELCPFNRGYLAVNLRLNRGVYCSIDIHRVICLTFHGQPPAGYTASHKNGNKYDNTKGNLIWETIGDNIRRKFVHGTHDAGSNNSRAKLDYESVIIIKKLLAKKELTHKEIGDMFGVSRAFITKINTGVRYKYEVSSAITT